MRVRFAHQAALAILLILQCTACLATETPDANESSKYLDAVRTFADNVLKYGRDTYGPKHIPLFVDGLNVNTHEPVEWIASNGDRWILSNLASQQNLFRTLDGLSKITGDPKYRQAAMEAIEYAFANLQAPNGLFYWGIGISYDAQADKPCGMGTHSLKSNYPYYKLMWEVDPGATRKFIEAYWSAHVLDWSNLEMNRGVPVDKPLGEAWNQEYKGGPVFFRSSGISMLVAGSDLSCAAGFLGEASDDDKPLVWAKQLIHRYVETRNPGVGLSGSKYTRWKTDRAQVQLGKDFKGHLVLAGTLFPGHPEIGNRAVQELVPAFSFATPGIRNNPAIAPWASTLLLGDMLDADGREFTQWALEELTAWGKVAYRKESNSFIPMLIDGTSLEGYVCKKSGYFGSEGTVFVPIPAVPMDFWTYALAYRITGDQFMWDMVRNIAHGYDLGDIGLTIESSPQLETSTDCWSPYTLLGFIELYKRTENQEFLQIARRIGDNLLAYRLHKGFFVPSDKHIYTKFDTMEHLALLHLHAALRRTFSSVPEYWPSNSLFNAPYRDREYASDYSVIYTLIESPYPAKSVEELIASGDVEGVRLFISQGGGVNALSEGSPKTPLHRAAIKGHKDVVELLLAVKDVHIDAEDEYSSTPLHLAVDGGHKEIVELLIAKGANINAVRQYGRTPLYSAAQGEHKDMMALLITHGADINAQQDALERTMLHEAAIGGQKELLQLLLAQGADVNAKDSRDCTPLFLALRRGRKEVLPLLLAHGADVNAKPENGITPLDLAVRSGDIEIVELLVDHGVQFNEKDPDGWNTFYHAVWSGNRELVDVFIGKGADISTFHMAAAMGDMAGINAFLEQGFAVDVKDEREYTSLSWATCMGQAEVVKLLIAQGGDVNLKIYGQATALHEAARVGDSDIIQLLITQGADVNAKEKDGSGPLHRAVQSGHHEVVQLLLANGADVSAKDSRGRTALDWAKLRNHSEIVELFRKHGAKE